jgi:protocatechuate 3,4-dioxygenase beta subunit
MATKDPTHNFPIHDDDRPVGRVLSRREILRRFGTLGVAFLAACSGVSTKPQTTPTTIPQQDGQLPPTPSGAPTAAPSAFPTFGPTNSPVAATLVPNTGGGTAVGCVVRPEMTEGPFFVEEKLERSDLRVDPSDNSTQEGIPLSLTFAVSTLANNTCAALAGAQVDVWHCNALGVYSDVAEGMGNANTQGKKFLRGFQKTGADGLATFTTIYPGWYRGRTVHIHFKIRTAAASGGTYDFTSQLFFDDALSDKVFQQAPYAKQGERDVRNAQDGIYRGGGDQLTLAPTQQADGYAANLAIALDLSNA